MPLPGEYVDPLPPTTFAQLMASIEASPRFLLQMTAGINFFSWHFVTGYAYLHPLGDGTGVFNSSVDRIIAVTVNGTALTPVTSSAAVATTMGSFYWDGYADQALVISMPDGSNPQAQNVTVEATAVFYFSDGPSDANGILWDNRIVSWPSITRRVTPDFSSITQIGNGSVTLANEDHYFDLRRRYNWDNGAATLYMTASGLPWSQAATLATFMVGSSKLQEGKFTFNLQDPKVLCDTLFPSVLYNQTNYPNLDPSAVGNPVQVAYGVIQGATPVCIDTVNGIYQVAGHPILSIDQVRVKDASDLWQPVAFSANTSLAQFTLTSYSPGASVVVDFSGKTNPNGSLMNNAADIVQDLLTQLGLTTDSAGFSNAHNWYDYGYINGNVLARAVVLAPSVYLDSQGSALTTIEEIMVNCRAYLQTAPTGGLTMTPFRSYSITNIPTINDYNNLTPGVVIDGSGTTSTYVQAGTKISQCVVNYGIRSAESRVQSVTWSAPANAYTRGKVASGQPQYVQEVVDSLFNNEADALYLAQAIVLQDRVDQSFWTVQSKWLGWNLLPGGGVHVKSPRLCLDQVLEIIGVTFDLNARRVTLTLGNLRGFEQSAGFWCNDSDLTPNGNSLAWPAGGELWDGDGETEYRRHYCGHWHGEDDFAVNTANLTGTWSDEDHAVSRWM